MLTVHYDGSAFYGWQQQPDQRTVQGVLHAAVGRLVGESRRITGAGRTDRGVHATGQVASLEVPSRWSAREFRRAMNAVLPDEVWLAECRRVPADFHPRYDAVARTYEYRLGLSPEAQSPFHRPWCWPVDREVSIDLLDRSAEVVRGRHSFEAFAKSGQEERGSTCTIHGARWQAWELGTKLVVSADRYLHHMVRYLVGTMVDVAAERRSLGELIALLERSDPDLVTSPPAPPQGLFLTRVEYPEEKTSPVDDEPKDRSEASR